MTADRPTAWVARHPTAVWVVALAFFGLGDLATSVVGLSFDLATEASPVVAALVAAFGLPALVVTKAAVLLICYGGWRLAPTPYGTAIPLCLAAIGVPVTVWNTYVLVMAM